MNGTILPLLSNSCKAKIHYSKNTAKHFNYY